MQNKINILGINIDNISKNDLKDSISSLLNSSSFQYIVTPNPEIILKAITDEEYFYIINNASLAPADGIGLKFAALVTGNIIPRITGVEITDELLNICNHLQKKVLIVNWKDGLSSDIDIQTALNKKYQDLNFFVHSMPRERDNWKSILNQTEILKYEPDVVFCLFGAPYQEKFIYHIAKKIPNVKLAIGVGGAFDFFTNKIKRAPGIFRIIGLEWLWRLIKQPKRWKRIYNAVVVFPFKFLRWQFILPLFYRKNVACLIYKKENNKRFVLLVEREDCEDYWQLPQGGTVRRIKQFQI